MSHRPRAVRVASLLVLSSVLVGCTPTGSFLLQRDGDQITFAPVVCTLTPIESLDVNATSRDSSTSIWSIQRVFESGVGVRAVTIGVLPPGYREVTPFRRDLLRDDVELLFDVNPADGNLNSVGLNDIPDDGNAYIHRGGGAKTRVASMDEYLDRRPEECADARSRTKRVTAVALLAAVGAAVLLVLTILLVRSRRSRSSYES